MKKPRRRLSQAEVERRKLARIMGAYTKVWPVLLDLRERQGIQAVRRVVRAVQVLLDMETPA